MARTSRSERGGGGAGAVRLFLALDLPGAARAEIARWRDTLVAGHDELRAVAVEALHVTLVFLGRRRQEQTAEIWALASAAAAGLPCPALTPAELVALPRRRPRLLALELGDDGGRAAAVHLALAGSLQEAGLYEPEARTFWPHVTLARIRGRSRLGDLDVPPAPGTAFQAPQLTLYRSDLHPAGARYVALERLQLGGGR